ncbi:metallopeptidase family protein [Nocardioides mesophilus]|uniref:Metallopeptidase family protein n=1 Tax=Nocardioides mesophilus TaxID=433659 RepID=A0A7G9RDE5_9ACTN|nr:metallopeptidase family protein [Nocardioides mesophilus]QNN53620.1 metallopeptidase family protein [Nocardioides mesophilus]
MTSTGTPVGRRGGSRRDRRGRGSRGPAVLPGPLSPGGVPATRSRRATFDDLVLAVVEDLEERWHDELGLVEFAVEEAPLVPDDWDADTVPLATLVPASGGTPARLVLFRRPIELRAETRADLSALVLTVLVEQVSELLGRPPEEIDSRYDSLE